MREGLLSNQLLLLGCSVAEYFIPEYADAVPVKVVLSRLSNIYIIIAVTKPAEELWGGEQSLME